MLMHFKKKSVCPLYPYCHLFKSSCPQFPVYKLAESAFFFKVRCVSRNTNITRLLKLYCIGLKWVLSIGTKKTSPSNVQQHGQWKRRDCPPVRYTNIEWLVQRLFLSCQFCFFRSALLVQKQTKLQYVYAILAGPFMPKQSIAVLQCTLSCIVQSPLI